MIHITTKKPRIALTISTGRIAVKRVVKSFLDNAELHGYDIEDFSVYLSIDTEYNNTRASDFKLDSNLERRLRNVDYITPKSREEIGRELISETGANPLIINSMFVGRGYSKQRNSALLRALQDENDLAICFDDDEAPYIPIKDKNMNIKWEALDFFTPHIKELLIGADVTRGPSTGYLSPIPSDLEEEIPEFVREKLGELLQLGNEVVSKKSFFNLADNIIYLSDNEITNPYRPYIVKNSKYGKTILSGNMGINLDSIRKGKLPIFYNPPNARGEDAFFGLQLKDNNVVEVPSYIFHDPFLLYPNLPEGNFPEKLETIPVNRKSIDRFADAVTGWLKYAPLFILMSSKTPGEREERISKMINDIEAPTRKMAELLDSPKLLDCRRILEDYNREVFKDYQMLRKSQETWREKVVPYCGSLVYS